jgi:magnesium transporter
MDVRVFRDGVVQDERVAVEDMGRVCDALGDGEWLWVDQVDPGPEDVRLLQRQLRLHDLAVEDVEHRGQRPKVEVFLGHLFVVLRPLSWGRKALNESELFLFASPRFLVTLRFSPAFDLEPATKRWPVLSQLAPGTGSALYAIMDEVTDDYLEVIEDLEDRADRLEGEVFREVHPRDRAKLQYEVLKLRRESVKLRRHAVPTRQAADRLMDESELMTEKLRPYLRDVTDHLLRVIELTDGVREILTTIVDIRMAQAANQLNEVMKKLTAWAGIILVPTLIAGIYGMNFRHMPELSWQVGYPLSLGLMAVSAIVLYVFFRRRDWL